MNSHQLINQSTGNQEWGTPSVIIEAARKVMGSIDLDPASCAKANMFVKAGFFHSKEADGLKHPWWGNVWINWPFGDRESACKISCTKKSCIKRAKLLGLEEPVHLSENRPGNSEWVNKLMHEWNINHINQATVICFASTSEFWFKPLKSYPQCYLNGRTNYIDLTTGLEVKGVSKGSVVTYLGNNLDAFVHYFGPMGDILWPTCYVDKRFFRGLAYESKIAT